MKTAVDGNWVTMITPFTEDNRLDQDGIKALVEWYIEKGVDGIFAVCQSSEMFYLSLRERLELAETVMHQANGRIQVVVSGHVSDSIDDQIEELRAMAGLGPDIVVLVSNRLAQTHESEEVWKKNAQRILDALPDTTFGIYECPYPYKRLLSPDLLRWCVQTERFAFLKDTCCNIVQIKEKLKAVEGSGLKIFNANAATLLESLKAGCSGFCGVMLNFHPELYVRINKIWRESPETASRLQDFAGLASIIESQLYPVNAKYHMILNGLPIGLKSRARSEGEFDELKRLATVQLRGACITFCAMD